MKTKVINKILSLGNYILVDDVNCDEEKEVRIFATALATLGLTILAISIPFML